MNPDGDKNQNISNNPPSADPTQQAIFTPLQTPAPESPRPAQDSSVIVGSVVEPASTGLTHQYYSNHPTKTIASGIGDVIIGDGSKSKRPKWPLILLGVAVAVILGVGVLLLVGKSNPSQPEENSIYGITNESRLAFHRYVNLLLKNEDSTAKPELLEFFANDYSLLFPAAMSAEQIKQGDPESAQAYFDALNSAYVEFSQLFFPQADENADIAGEYSRRALSDYFFEASRGSYLGLNQIFSLYTEKGEDHVRELADNVLKSDSDNETIKSLLEARKKQVDLYLNALYRADQAGCIVENSLDSNCARPIFDAIGSENVVLLSQINELEIKLRREAISTLENIYYEFYPDEIVIEEGVV